MHVLVHYKQFYYIMIFLYSKLMCTLQIYAHAHMYVHRGQRLKYSFVLNSLHSFFCCFVFEAESLFEYEADSNLVYHQVPGILPTRLLQS